MKVLSILLVALVFGFALATSAAAECAGHQKTATVTPPATPVASTSKG
jgi:hypothetical protein